MTPLLRLAWRNVWRNARRSALTVSSIACGLAAVMFGQSLLKSFQRQMVEKSTGVMLGHVQAQAAAATDRKIPDRLLADPAPFLARVRGDPRVAAAGTRLLFTGLVQTSAGSRAVLVCGVEPEAEKRLSILPGYLTSGRYLGEGRDILMGDKLAGELDLRLGEKAVVLGQNPRGEMSAELFRLAGLYHSGSAAYDGQIVYIPLAAAQRLRETGPAVSHAVVRLHDVTRAREAARDWAGSAGPGGSVVTHEEVGSEIVGIQRFEDALLVVVLAVIFAIVGLGILNTVSMSFYERVREFGVLRAIGARPRHVMAVLVVEAALMGAVGVVLGGCAGTAVIAYFGVQGLPLPVGEALSYFMPFDDVVYLAPAWRLHLWSSALLFAISVAAALGPSIRAARLEVSKALRHL